MAAVGLSARDLAIVRLVTSFKQLTTAHINELLFPANSSRSSCDRALQRLTKQNYLHRIERRAPGGRLGGSGHYVYALGRRGFFLSAVGLIHGTCCVGVDPHQTSTDVLAPGEFSYRTFR